MSASCRTSEIDATIRKLGRRNVIPIVHVRGTHYEVGFDIGRTFAEMIKDFVDIYSPLNQIYLSQFETEEGRKIYDETLEVVKKQFPQYVRELEGTADGANVPFFKLFLMHLDDIIMIGTDTRGTKLPAGCSSIMCNQPGQEILGHNEDALSETLNHWYLVSAHVIETGCREEKFTSLSYAGFLPGYTMGYNHHGLVYSINTLGAMVLRSAKTPRYFLTRALLGAESYVQAQETLLNSGCGAAEGFSVNMTFLAQEGDRMFHNIEVAPAEDADSTSQLNILSISPGKNAYHCNKYLHLEAKEQTEALLIRSSIRRMAALSKHQERRPCRSWTTREDVLSALSDQTDDEFRVYQEIDDNDHVKTIATGIFDCVKRTWSIYTDKPQCNEPVLVIPMEVREPSTRL